MFGVFICVRSRHRNAAWLAANAKPPFMPIGLFNTTNAHNAGDNNKNNNTNDDGDDDDDDVDNGGGGGGGDVLFISCTETWIVVAPFVQASPSSRKVRVQDAAIAEWQKLQMTLTQTLTPSEERRAQLRDAVDARLKAALDTAAEWLVHAASPANIYITSRNGASCQLSGWLLRACKNTPALQGKQVKITHLLT